MLYFEPSFPKKLIPEKISVYFLKVYKIKNQKKDSNNLGLPQNWQISLIIIFIFFQLIIPFRHHLYPGHTNWHEEGSLLCLEDDAKAKRNRDEI